MSVLLFTREIPGPRNHGLPTARGRLKGSQHEGVGYLLGSRWWVVVLHFMAGTYETGPGVDRFWDV